MTSWFSGDAATLSLNADAPRLHTRTRPGAWTEWASAIGSTASGGPGQIFDLFYFSLQADLLAWLQSLA